MGINIKNYLTRLGIETEDIETKLEELTNEEVDELYADRLVDIYISLQKKYREGKNDMEWEEKEDKLSEQLYRQIGSMQPKVKIIILENKIDELEKTKAEEISLRIRKENYRVAYETLKTEEGRREYAKTLQDQKRFDQDLEDLIKREGGNPKQILDTKILGKGNVANKVKREEVPEYNVEYQDDNITLCSLALITFDNGQYLDKLKKYILFHKRPQSNITKGYDFYGEIEVQKMQDADYRIALYEAIKQRMKEEKNYIGYLGKDKQGFYIVKDIAQELAALKYESQQKEMRRKNYNQKEVRE